MKNQSSRERYIAKFLKSRALYERALGMIPRGVTHDARFILPFPIYITHAHGSHKWDVDGYEYIDYWMGHGALVLGHAHPSVVDAVREQVAQGTHYGAEHELVLEWASLIKKLIPCAERIEFTSSGTEADMLAVRLARAFTGRRKVVKFADHFFGWSDELMKGLNEPYDRPPGGGFVVSHTRDTIVIPANDEAALENALSDGDVAILMLEASGARMGVTGIESSFYQTMRDLTKKYGTLLHFDEVVTGFRYSPGGVQAVIGITPDLTALGKAVAGGIPGAGAVVGRADVMEMLSFKKDDAEWNRYKRVMHPGTFNANPFTAAAGVAALKILATGEPQKQAEKMAVMLRRGMQQVLDNRGMAGCVYGDMGNYHIYFGECELQDKCDRRVCLNSTKVRNLTVGESLALNLTLNNVHTLSRGLDGVLSAAHSKADINRTVEGFDTSIDTMLKEGVLQANK